MSSKPLKLTKLGATAILNGFVKGEHNDANVKAGIAEMKEAISKKTPAQLNEFINNILNKTIYSKFFNTTIFKNPLGRFIQSSTNPAAHLEVLTNQLLEVEDYDGDTKIAPDFKEARVLQTYLKETIYKKIRNSFQDSVARAAFISEQSFSSYLEGQVAAMTETMNINLYETMSKQLVSEIVNTVDFTSVKKVDDVLMKINIMIDQMRLCSDAFNLGYQCLADVANDNYTSNPDNALNIRKNTITESDLVLVLSPRMKQLLTAKTTRIYHNEYFSIKKFDTVVIGEEFLKDGANDEFMILVDKKAYQAWFRINEIASQRYANPLKQENILHYWMVSGLIPWANGIKLKLNYTSIAKEPLAEVVYKEQPSEAN